jgi:hypothetical protein
MSDVCPDKSAPTTVALDASIEPWSEASPKRAGTSDWRHRERPSYTPCQIPSPRIWKASNLDDAVRPFDQGSHTIVLPERLAALQPLAEDRRRVFGDVTCNIALIFLCMTATGRVFDGEDVPCRRCKR